MVEAPSRARKILRRTLSGGALVLALAGLLVWTAHSQSGMPLFAAVALVLGAAVIETSRMGSLALLDLRPPLLLSAVAVLLVSRFLMDPGPTGYGLSLCVAVLCALALHGATRMFVRLVRRTEPAQLLALALVGGVLVAWFTPLLGAQLQNSEALIVLALIAAVTVPLAALEPGGGARLLAVGGLALWLVPPLPATWIVWSHWETGGLVALLALSKIGDSAAYYVGSAIGKRHPFPRLSPGKTVAGCVASFVAATLLGGVLAAAGVLPQGQFGLAGGLVAGATLIVAAQAGDLLESWVKRRAGVKDSSRVFGPSGGILDQIDSLLVSVPVALVTWPLLFPR